MSTSHNEVSKFASENYAAYKNAYADYVFLLMSAVAAMDTSAQKSRARTHDMAIGRTGDQITIPLEDMKYHDAEAERLEAEANASYQHADEITQRGAMHHAENTDDYYTLAMIEDKHIQDARNRS